MFAATATSKYCGELHADIAKLVPKFGKLFTAVENVVLHNEDSDGPSPETLTALKALAKKLDDELEEYNEVNKAYLKVFPKGKKQQKA